MAALERTQIKIQSPGSGWELAYPSAVTMDDEGLFYILQRGDKADPVLVVDKDGKIVRSWGKGMYEIPTASVSTRRATFGPPIREVR